MAGKSWKCCVELQTSRQQIHLHDNWLTEATLCRLKPLKTTSKWTLSWDWLCNISVVNFTTSRGHCWGFKLQLIHLKLCSWVRVCGFVFLCHSVVYSSEIFHICKVYFLLHTLEPVSEGCLCNVSVLCHVKTRKPVSTCSWLCVCSDATLCWDADAVLRDFGFLSASLSMKPRGRGEKRQGTLHQ